MRLRRYIAGIVMASLGQLSESRRLLARAVRIGKAENLAWSPVGS